MSRRDELEKSSVMAGVLPKIPFGVGSDINEIFRESAFRYAQERTNKMIEEIAQHIDALGETKIDREWFRGEEFQTLLFEALHQLYVTHSEERIKMLGKALANSGAVDFKDESRKDIFLRLIRELAPQHIEMLRRLLPPKRPSTFTAEQYPDSQLWNNRPNIVRRGTDLLVLQMLAANSLVKETPKANKLRVPSISLTSSESDAQRALNELVKQIQEPPERSFALSELGRDFLKFVGGDGENASKRSDYATTAE